jgi:hypothetical protein
MICSRVTCQQLTSFVYKPFVALARALFRTVASICRAVSEILIAFQIYFPAVKLN